MAKKQKARPTGTRQDNWQNTAKEQPYLMPGTETYEEYESDLQLHDPFRPDDVVHDKLEQHNEDIVEARTEAGWEPHRELNVPRWKARNKMFKATQIGELREQAVEQAALTDDPEDDEKAKSKRLPAGVRELVENDGVSQDEFLPRALLKYQ